MDGSSIAILRRMLRADCISGRCDNCTSFQGTALGEEAPSKSVDQVHRHGSPTDVIWRIIRNSKRVAAWSRQ